MPNEEYNEEEGYRDDGLLPDGVHHEKLPLTKEDQKQYEGLERMFAQAWIHG